MGEHDLDRNWPAIEQASVSDEFDLDKWLDGSCGVTRRARIYQRGDLITAIDKLEEEKEIAAEVEKSLPKGERGLNDRTAAQIQAEIDDLSTQVADSALILHVQDRTGERRNTIRERFLKEQELKEEDTLSFEDNEILNYRLIGDSIIKLETPGGKVKELPDGLPANKLREIVERVGDAACSDLWYAYRRVTMEAPQVSAPLSRPSSSAPGGIT